MSALDHLSDLQVQALIKSSKEMKENLPIEMPEFGKIKDDTLVLGHYNHIEYKLHRYRHPIDSERFSIHIRFVENNEQLLRVDINNGTHRNPDGEKIQQNHIHIYKNSEYSKDAYAVPLPGEFSNLESIFSALNDFLVYTNIN